MSFAVATYYKRYYNNNHFDSPILQPQHPLAFGSPETRTDVRVSEKADRMYFPIISNTATSETQKLSPRERVILTQMAHEEVVPLRLPQSTDTLEFGSSEESSPFRWYKKERPTRGSNHQQLDHRDQNSLQFGASPKISRRRIYLKKKCCGGGGGTCKLCLLILLIVLMTIALTATTTWFLMRQRFFLSSLNNRAYRNNGSAQIDFSEDYRRIVVRGTVRLLLDPQKVSSYLEYAHDNLRKSEHNVDALRNVKRDKKPDDDNGAMSSSLYPAYLAASGCMISSSLCKADAVWHAHIADNFKFECSRELWQRYNEWPIERVMAAYVLRNSTLCYWHRCHSFSLCCWKSQSSKSGRGVVVLSYSLQMSNSAATSSHELSLDENSSLLAYKIATLLANSALNRVVDSTLFQQRSAALALEGYVRELEVCVQQIFPLSAYEIDESMCAVRAQCVKKVIRDHRFFDHFVH